MEHFQTLGRSDYRHGNFGEALKNFDRALNKGQSVQLLDNRAACHEKLGNLPAALRDAKAIIRLSKADATGYLRASRVLTRMKKKDVAAEVCMHGLRHVRHVGQGYELLCQSLRVLQDELHPKSRTDPLTVLPRELAEEIFTYLSFKQRIVASSTSRSWTQFLRTSPRLWKHLDLSTARRFIKPAFFSRAINVARPKIAEVSINANCELDMSLKAIVHHCAIQHLKLQNAGPQSHSLITILKEAAQLRSLRIGDGCEIRTHAFHALWRSCVQRLEVFECERLSSPNGIVSLPNVDTDCTSLTVLRLVAAPGNDFEHGADMTLLRKMPNLVSLCLRTNGTGHHCARSRNEIDCTALTKLRTLDLTMYVAAHTLGLPQTLETLRLSTPPGKNMLPFFSRTEMEPTTYHLPALRELSLDIPSLNWDAIESFVSLARCENTNGLESVATNLCSLSITLHTLPTLDEFAAAASDSRLQKLQHFGLRAPVSQNAPMDRLMCTIITSFKQLQSLDLSESDLTGVGLKYAVQRGVLRRIVLNDCNSIGKDAIDWAMVQGLQIEQRVANGISGSRKVRYQ